MKSLTLLGSTGSIGVNTLDVVRRNREQYGVHALVAGNNVACLLLLLNRHAVTPFATDSAFVSARDLYQRFPTDPRYVSTYAYALHVRGNSAEALKIMQTLRQEQLAEPATALYYGVLLSARGEVAEAAKYLALAAGNAKLLPEEKQLLEEARLAAR